MALPTIPGYESRLSNPEQALELGFRLSILAENEADAAKAFKLVKDIASWLPEETVTLVQGEIEKWLATDQPDLDDPLMEPVAPVVNVYILSGWWKGDDQEANAPACTFALEEDHLPKNGWTCQGAVREEVSMRYVLPHSAEALSARANSQSILNEGGA